MQGNSSLENRLKWHLTRGPFFLRSGKGLKLTKSVRFNSRQLWLVKPFTHQITQGLPLCLAPLYDFSPLFWLLKYLILHYFNIRLCELKLSPQKDIPGVVILHLLMITFLLFHFFYVISFYHRFDFGADIFAKSALNIRAYTNTNAMEIALNKWLVFTSFNVYLF